MDTRTRVEEELERLVKSTAGYKLDADAEERMLDLCDLADTLNIEFGAEYIQFDVEPAGLHGVICVDVLDIILKNGRKHPFFEYIKSADFLTFSQDVKDRTRIQFGVKDLWVKA